ncbi:protein canopy homolog 1-like [Saccoglossus kowalevskii]|uniref:Protein canopy homolog 1-like n=1 Tax=Saccoglossus kowalevskii TaxID=10224 RepID=A0ABM0GN88_SACKO|nr:PREDICTED: protein canopy homolog 1-like [Saccoglossus kowalevskii]
MTRMLFQLFVFGLLYLHLAIAKKDMELYCGACLALVDEVEYAINSVDPRETIDVGSFRVLPDGSQKQMKVPYATSEVHLMEVLETVCDQMKDYALHTDPDTDEKSYMRYNNRENEKDKPITLSNVSISADVSKALRIACENIVEDYEDDIIHLFTNKQNNIHYKLCADSAELCNDMEDTPPPKDEL